MDIDDDFFIDFDDYVVVCDPQHGMGCRLRKATEEDHKIYTERLKKKLSDQFEANRQQDLGL